MTDAQTGSETSRDQSTLIFDTEYLNEVRSQLLGVGVRPEPAFVTIELAEHGVRAVAVDAQTGRSIAATENPTLSRQDFDHALADHLVRTNRIPVPTSDTDAYQLMNAMPRVRDRLLAKSRAFAIGYEPIGLVEVTREDVADALRPMLTQVSDLWQDAAAAADVLVSAVVVLPGHHAWPGLSTGLAGSTSVPVVELERVVLGPNSATPVVHTVDSTILPWHVEKPIADKVADDAAPTVDTSRPKGLAVFGLGSLPRVSSLSRIPLPHFGESRTSAPKGLAVAGAGAAAAGTAGTAKVAGGEITKAPTATSARTTPTRKKAAAAGTASTGSRASAGAGAASRTAHHGTAIKLGAAASVAAALALAITLPLVLNDDGSKSPRSETVAAQSSAPVAPQPSTVPDTQTPDANTPAPAAAQPVETVQTQQPTEQQAPAPQTQNTPVAEPVRQTPQATQPDTQQQAPPPQNTQTQQQAPVQQEAPSAPQPPAAQPAQPAPAQPAPRLVIPIPIPGVAPIVIP